MKKSWLDSIGTRSFDYSEVTPYSIHTLVIKDCDYNEVTPHSLYRLLMRQTNNLPFSSPLAKKRSIQLS